MPGVTGRIEPSVSVTSRAVNCRPTTRCDWPIRFSRGFELDVTFYTRLPPLRHGVHRGYTTVTATMGAALDDNAQEAE